MGLFSRKKKTDSSLDLGLHKTRRGFFSRMADALLGKSVVDDEVLESIEEALIGSDVGIDTTSKIMDRLQERVRREKGVTTDKVMEILKEEISDMLTVSSTTGVSDQEYVDSAFTDSSKVFDFSKKPYIMMVVGVNGVGKTTTIGKLAKQLSDQGKRVLLAAADTFRAAAIDQLDIWAQRSGCEIIKQNEGSDPAAVIFDAIAAAKARGADVIICDTAGRLHNKRHLMDELAKINRIIDRELPDAAKEKLLVLDATTGQNAVNQAEQFREATGITGIVLTKLDGTAKGGVVLAIKEGLGIPVKFIGVGEQIDDLQPFDAQDFARALFDSNE